MNPNSGGSSSTPTVTKPPAATTDPKISDSTRFNKGSISFTPPTRKCFKCHGFDHIASSRPTRSLITFTEQGKAVKQEEVTEGVEEDEWQLEADDGELLMVRRALHTTATLDDEWLRHNNFCIRCIVGGKVCSLIINGSNCENVISHKMLEKLDLPTQQHPTPYSLSWVKKENDIRVDRRCLVDFSIGTKLREQVWCDILMDAYHILLGRPCQFDRKMIHDGFKNAYTFTKEGKKIVLLPWRGEETENSSPVG